MMAQEKTQGASTQPMAGENGGTQAQGQQQQFVCTGDCLNCHPNQRQYCSAQKGYDNQRLLLEMRGSMMAMAAAIEELKAKISEAEKAEAQVFAPNDIAQNG
jgi:hypothetical protein